MFVESLRSSSFAERERRIEEYYAETSIHAQLDDFFKSAEEGDRHWLRSPELDVYVRRNTRPYGELIGQVFLPEGGVYHPKDLLATVSCLDIGDVELKSDKTLDSWERFIVGAYVRCPWESLYLDEVGDPKIREWCATRLNSVLNEAIPERSGQSFYLQTPPKTTKIIAARAIHL